MFIKEIGDLVAQSGHNRPMELRQLEYFVAVAEELSFTRAAERLHVVQSAVSAAIRSLERELGPTLFERSSQRVTLTAAGAALLPAARNTLDSARAAREAAQLSEGRLQGTLRIGTFSSLVRPDLPELLGRFHRLHPAVTLRLAVSPRGSAGLVERLLAGNLDLAFVALPGDPRRDCMCASSTPPRCRCSFRPTTRWPGRTCRVS
ncbi:LysR family transcriptional regulator [Streptomyces chiangmaiensis]